jgi:hypothetical protein
MNTWSTVVTLARYWIKGRITRVTTSWIIIWEAFMVIMILFVGGTYLSFSSQFNLSGEVSYIGLSLLFALSLVGLIQSGFNGWGLPVTAADVDYVFTSPVKPRDIFAAKVLMNSLTTVLLSLPPILALYLRLAAYYGAPFVSALLAGLVTLIYFVMGLFLSADITLSLSLSIGPRLKLLRNALALLVIATGLAPLTLLIPGAPSALYESIRVMPSGLVAEVSFGLLNGLPWNLTMLQDLVMLLAWFFILLTLGIRMSRRFFYEVIQIEEPISEELNGTKVGSHLKTEGRDAGSVVRQKERIVMNRTREIRGLLINAMLLSGFMVIYSLSGVFQSSPASFLLILFTIGSFGTGSAERWLEKERLWIIKASSLDMTRYMREAYRARVTPLLLLISPVAVAIGAPLLIGQASHPSSLLGIGLSLPGALETVAMTMAGGMYFAARYGQSTSDDIILSQGQDMTDVKMFLYQTIVNLLVVSPLMIIVLAAGPSLAILGYSSLVPVSVAFAIVGVAYTLVIIDSLLTAAGRIMERREDL